MASPLTEQQSAINDASRSDPIAQVKPILEAEAQHGPIFRRELFDAAYAAFSSIHDDDDDLNELVDGRPTSLLRDDITLLDVYGSPQKVGVLRAGMRRERDGKTYVKKRVWSFNSLQHLAYGYGESSNTMLLPFNFGTTDADVEEDNCSADSIAQEDAELWRKEWEASQFHQQLVSILEQNAGKTTKRIDNIICFGLSCPLLRQYQPKSTKRSYVQHLAACTIRDILAIKQGDPPPKIYAQDPIYCPNAEQFLKDTFDISVLPDSEGFRALTGSSFVITVAPNVPVRQIALGLTHDSGGPAGFLCNALSSEGLECDGKGKWFDEEKTIYLRRTCDSSPALWRYRQESIWFEYDDGEEEDFFGKMGLYLKKREGGDGNT